MDTKAPSNPTPTAEDLAAATIAEGLLGGGIESQVQALLEAVDLSIAYSPVCPDAHDARVVRDVRRTMGGGYCVVEVALRRSSLTRGRGTRHGTVTQWDARNVDAAQLTVWRARYLWRKGVYHQLLMRDLLLPMERDTVIASYFDGVWLDVRKMMGGHPLPPLSHELEAAWNMLPRIR